MGAACVRRGRAGVCDGGVCTAAGHRYHGKYANDPGGVAPPPAEELHLPVPEQHGRV